MNAIEESVSPYVPSDSANPRVLSQEDKRLSGDLPLILRKSDIPGMTTKKRREINTWLQLFAKTGRKVKSALDAGLAREEIYTLCTRHPIVRQLVTRCEELAGDLLEDVAVDRIVNGTSRPVYQGGELVGEIREYPERLHIACLQARNKAFRAREDKQAGSGLTLNFNFFQRPQPSIPAPVTVDVDAETVPEPDLSDVGHVSRPPDGAEPPRR